MNLMLLPSGIMPYVNSWNKLRKIEAHHKDEKMRRERKKDWAQPIITCSLSQSYQKGDHLRSCSFQATGLLRTLFQRIIFTWIMKTSEISLLFFWTFPSTLSPKSYISFPGILITVNSFCWSGVFAFPYIYSGCNLVLLYLNKIYLFLVLKV